jgi:hypothetical protein
MTLFPSNQFHTFHYYKNVLKDFIPIIIYDYSIRVISAFISFARYPSAPLLTNDRLIPSNPLIGG